MASTSFDPRRSKICRGPIWDSAAQGYRIWWPHIEKAAQSLSNRLVELAEIRTGQRILDIATGIGEPALTAARVVGVTGHVLAIDISTEMLAIAKQRAVDNGSQDIIEYWETAAQDLVLPDLSVDAVLCRWGLMFLPNLNSTLLKVHRSLVSGGRFVAAVWAYAHKVPVISLAMQIIGESVEMATESLPSVPNPFGLADKNRLSNSFLGAGFRDVGIETVTVTFEFSSGEDYSRYCQAISTGARIFLSTESEERKKFIWSKVAKYAATRYATATGSIRMDNECICIVATKP
ncbi:MAG: methyltransferase domain-containing protein [Nitrososphaeraceae archaeon]